MRAGFSLLILLLIMGLFMGCGEKGTDGLNITGEISFPADAPGKYDISVEVTNNGDSDQSDLTYKLFNDGLVNGIVNATSPGLVNSAPVGFLQKGGIFNTVERHNISDISPGRHIVDWKLYRSDGALMDTESKSVDF